MNPHLAVPSPCLSTMVYSLQLSSVFHSVIKILMIHESTVHILLLTLDGAGVFFLQSRVLLPCGCLTSHFTVDQLVRLGNGGGIVLHSHHLVKPLGVLHVVLVTEDPACHDLLHSTILLLAHLGLGTQSLVGVIMISPPQPVVLAPPCHSIFLYLINL